MCTRSQICWRRIIQEKLYSAIERKAAGWAVTDADTRLTGKGARGDHKGAYSATISCEHHAKGTCARGDKCRFSHRSSDSKSGGKGNEGKKSKSEKDRCKKCGKTTNPPHWAKSCPENSSSSAQAVLTSTPVSPPPEVAPPGLSTPVNNSANSENVVALAAILRDVLFPSGSSESARATRLATLARSAGYVVRQRCPVFAALVQTKHWSMVVDSGTELHLVCPAHKHFLTNVTKLSVPLQLETAGGDSRDLTLDVIGDLFCGGIVCHGCVFTSLLSVSLFSADRGEKDGYFYERCPGLWSVERIKRKCENRTFWTSGLPTRRRGTTCFSCFAHTWLGRWKLLSCG